MYVRFWGTRGSIASPGESTARYGGNTSCVEVRAADGTVIVLDCGTGARELGLHLVRTMPAPMRLHLFIGHTHWDHIQGFPFFVPAFLPGSELNVYAPLGFQQSLEEAMSGQMEYSYFPVKLRDLRSRIHFTELEEGFFRVGDVLVETQYLNHTAPTIAYRMSSGGATVAYVTDHEPFWKSEDGVLHHPGDQRHIAFMRGADLVIHDAQYTHEEYANRLGWGHSTVEYATDVALAASVKRLALFPSALERPRHEIAPRDWLQAHAEGISADLQARGVRAGQRRRHRHQGDGSEPAAARLHGAAAAHQAHLVRAAPARAGRADVPRGDLGLQRSRRSTASATITTGCAATTTRTTRRRCCRKGTILHIIGYMDNSPTNKNVPDPRNWQGSGNRSVANMFIDLGIRVALTDEQFQEEMAKRRENLKLTKNDVVIGCPLCLVIAGAGQGGGSTAAVNSDRHCGQRDRRPTRFSASRTALRDPSSLRISLWLCRGLLRVCCAGAQPRQSLTYTKGQNVAPAYEGWEQAPDGTKYFLFGYMNRNWEEEIDVPIGPDNGFNVGGADQGQPTHFLPRRNRFVFRVRVPAGFTEKDELIWTLTTHGKTEKAYATLRPDYIVDDVVKASETGALGAGTSSPEVRSNKPPAVRIEEVKARNVKVGEWLTLVAEVKDDGIPKPRDPSRVAAAQARARRTDAGGAGRTAEKSRDVPADQDHGRQEPRAARLLVRLPRARNGRPSTRRR